MDIEGAAAPDAEGAAKSPPAKVIVTDVDISFFNLIGLLVKIAFAAIPAAIIIAFAVAIGFAMLGQIR